MMSLLFRGIVMVKMVVAVEYMARFLEQPFQPVLLHLQKAQLLFQRQPLLQKAQLLHQQIQFSLQQHALPHLQKAQPFLQRQVLAPLQFFPIYSHLTRSDQLTVKQQFLYQIKSPKI